MNGKYEMIFTLFLFLMLKLVKGSRKSKNCFSSQKGETIVYQGINFYYELLLNV